MRVILKPGAIFALVVVLGVLGFLAINRATQPTPPPPVTASSAAPAPPPAGDTITEKKFYEFPTAMLAYARRDTVVSEDKPAGTEMFYRITINKVPKNMWDVSSGVVVLSPTAAEGKFVYHIWARSPTNNQVEMLVEENKAPYKRYLSEKVTLTPEWKEYIFPLTITDAYPQTNGTAARVHMGANKGTIELADLRVVPAP